MAPRLGDSGLARLDPSGSPCGRNGSSARSTSTSSTCCGPLTPTRCRADLGRSLSRPVSRPGRAEGTFARATAPSWPRSRSPCGVNSRSAANQCRIVDERRAPRVGQPMRMSCGCVRARPTESGSVARSRSCTPPAPNHAASRTARRSCQTIWAGRRPSSPASPARPQGATFDQVAEALSPVRRLSPSTRSGRWRAERPAWLDERRRADNPTSTRTYDARSNRWHPAVRTDWQDSAGPRRARMPRPRRHRHLVQSAGADARPPLSKGLSERHFAWAEPCVRTSSPGWSRRRPRGRPPCPRDPRMPPSPGRRQRSAGIVDPANEMLWRDTLRPSTSPAGPRGPAPPRRAGLALANDLESDLEPRRNVHRRTSTRWSAARAAR